MSLVKRLKRLNVSDADLAGALHEVSNALTVVLGWLNEARSKLPDGEVRNAVEVAYTHAQRGHSVARSAIGGKSAGEPAARSADSLMREALLAVAPEAEARGVHARGEGVVHSALDGADAVLQVLVNLLLNAIAFSPPDGQVRLSVSVAQSRVVFRVSDDGPGVPSQQHAELFRRGHSMRPGGAGIGLSHSHSLAERYGGELRLVSSAHGASFELSWPGTEAPSRTVQSVPLAALNGLTVLVLEDDPAIMTMVQMGLAARGIEVLGASGLDDLGELVARGAHYDAAFIDLSPIQDDPQAAIELLKRGKPELPVILISGSAVAGEADLPLSAWVQKPFEVAELYRALAELFAPTELKARAS